MLFLCEQQICFQECGKCLKERKITNVQVDMITFTTVHEATKATQISQNWKGTGKPVPLSPLCHVPSTCPLFPVAAARRAWYWRRCFSVACAFCCLLSDVLFLTSVSPTVTNGSFLLPFTYSSLTKLLGSSYRKELSSIGTFSYNHLTLQSSKSNPFSSWNNLLKRPLRHTACLYSLPLMPWKHQKYAEVSPVAVASFNVIHEAFKAAIHFVDKKSEMSPGKHSPQFQYHTKLLQVIQHG